MTKAEVCIKARSPPASLPFKGQVTEQRTVKWSIDVSFSCVCPVIDHEFRHNIVKVVVDPRGDSRVEPQTTLTVL